MCNPAQQRNVTKGMTQMANAKAKAAINLAALNLGNIGTADNKRTITNDKVIRPTRDIVANIHEAVRANAWRVALETIADMHGKNVEAKGANWIVNDDEAARAIRVNYNLIQPDYYTDRRIRKMDTATSKEVWTQICEQLEKNPPVFSEMEEEKDSDDKE